MTTHQRGRHKQHRYATLVVKLPRNTVRHLVADARTHGADVADVVNVALRHELQARREADLLAARMFAELE